MKTTWCLGHFVPEKINLAYKDLSLQLLTEKPTKPDTSRMRAAAVLICLVALVTVSQAAISTFQCQSPGRVSTTQTWSCGRDGAATCERTVKECSGGGIGTETSGRIRYSRSGIEQTAVGGKSWNCWVEKCQFGQNWGASGSGTKVTGIRF